MGLGSNAVIGWVVPGVLKALCLLETSVTTNPQTSGTSPEEMNSQKYDCENIKSQTCKFTSLSFVLIFKCSFFPFVAVFQHVSSPMVESDGILEYDHCAKRV